MDKYDVIKEKQARRLMRESLIVYVCVLGLIVGGFLLFPRSKMARGNTGAERADTTCRCKGHRQERQNEVRDTVYHNGK